MIWQSIIFLFRASTADFLEVGSNWRLATCSCTNIVHCHPKMVVGKKKGKNPRCLMYTTYTPGKSSFTRDGKRGKL